MNPRISIIVPIYNTEGYLIECLDSILAQTFEDWECFLIDDGSTDGSGYICDEYSKKDTRFHVIHKKNEGVSAARNDGIRESTGEWLYFVDSDDTLYSNALAIFVEMMGTSVDAIMAGYTVSPEYYERIILKPINLIYKVISVTDALTEMYKPSDFSYQGYLWCKLFKKSIIDENNLKFNESIYFNEDRLFVVEYLCKCNNIVAYTTTPVYGYVNRSTGVMGSLNQSYNPNYITDFAAYLQMYNVIRSYTRDSDLINYAKQGIVRSFLQNMKMMENFNVFNIKAYRYMRMILRQLGGVKIIIRMQFRTIAGNLVRLYWPSIAIKLKNK